MHSRRVLALVSAVLTCVLLAACGSSKPSGSRGPSAAAFIRFADCMRANGVPTFPDPQGGGGIQIPTGSGIDPQSPAFQSAQKVCFKLLPGGGPLHGGQASEQRKLMMLHLSQCMRRHGFPSFPDPTANPPALGPGTGGGIAFGSPGSFIAVSGSMAQSPGFQQAAATCGFPGAGRGGKRSLRIG